LRKAFLISASLAERGTPRISYGFRIGYREAFRSGVQARRISAAIWGECCAFATLGKRSRLIPS
jgi:hypothetical protein